VYKGHNIRNIR